MQSSAIVLLAICLIAQAQSAPVEDTTTAATNSPSGSNMIAAHTHNQLSNSSFSCYGRQVGYYADVDTKCIVYHFCLLGEFNGQEVYQRVSYMCLNDTVFDQRSLDCVEQSKATTPCKESEKYFDESNNVLRKSLVIQPTNNATSTEEKTDKKDGDKDGHDKDEENETEDKKEEDKKDD